MDTQYKKALILATILCILLFCLGLVGLLGEVGTQHTTYNDCRNERRSIMALILNHGTVSNGVKQIQVRYNTYKAGDVTSYMMVDCFGNLCSNVYVTGNNLMVY